MGVSGFTTFLDGNNYLLSDFKLRDTKLVIDGNNFYHFIYYLYQVPHVYGGDYLQFSKICRTFFESLMRCNVTPYVVFDGAYDLTGIKFKSAITRAGKKMVAANAVAHGESYRVLPLLTHEAFINVLNELNIKHATCNFEADRHIACLASSFNSPVLTNDSDFFVFDLPAGVILLDYFDVSLRHDNDGAMFMKAQLFKVQRLLQHMKLPDASFVALFATVLGNDIVDKTTFESFLARFTISQTPNNKKKARKRFAKIAGLLKWLSNKKHIEGAISDVIEQCALDRREKMRALVYASLATYNVSHSYLQDLFTDYEAFSKGNSTASEGMSNKHGEECPQRLQSALNRGEVSARVLNLWMSDKLILQPQVETFSQASSHLVSRGVRTLLHALLSSGRRSEFREYVKKDGKLSREVVKSAGVLKMPVTFPLLERLFEESDEERLALYLEMFPEKSPVFMIFSEKYRLMISALLYWAVSSTPTKTMVMASLLGLLTPEVMLKMVPFEVVADVSTMVGEHLSKSKHRNKYFNSDVVFSLNQFQSCLQSLLDLNSLLSHPLMPCHIAFDSSSILFIHHYLDLHVSNIEAYVQSVSKEVAAEKCALVVEVFGLLSRYSKTNSDVLRKNISKKTKQKKEVKVVEVVGESDEVVEEVEDYSDVENKFSCLKLCAND